VAKGFALTRRVPRILSWYAARGEVVESAARGQGMFSLVKSTVVNRTRGDCVVVERGGVFQALSGSFR